MPFSLPPELEKKRQALARRELRFLNCILVPVFLILCSVLWFGGNSLLRNHLAIVEALAFLCISSFFAAAVYTFRQREQRAIELGLVCPRCGKSIYVGRNFTLQALGECPRCHAFVIEELQKKYGTSPIS